MVGNDHFSARLFPHPPSHGDTVAVSATTELTLEADVAGLPRPWRVVVADDAEGLRDLLCLLLGLEDDFDVVGDAGDGASAVDVAVTQAADVVLLDLSMPVMDGLAALDELRRRLPAARVVVYTGDDIAVVGPDVLAAGAWAVIQKDGAVVDIAGRLREILAVA